MSHHNKCVKHKPQCHVCKPECSCEGTRIDECEPGRFYIKGKSVEVSPGVLIEKGTTLFPEKSIRGKMQSLTFKFASVFGLAGTGIPDNVEKAVQLLNDITYPDSQLYYPSAFGFEYNREIITEGVRAFPSSVKAASVWFPENGWVFNTSRKYGIVGSGGEKKCYYHFCVEVQFRQTNTRGANPDVVTNDCWSIFTDEKIEKFYQIKEWLDGQVRRLQPQRTPGGNEILTLDYENINILPWPPVGKCITSNTGAGFTNLPNGSARFPTSVSVSGFAYPSDIPGCTQQNEVPC